MIHLPRISMNFAMAIAVVILIPALQSSSTLNAAAQTAATPSTTAAISNTPESNASVAAARISSMYGKLPISFEANQGQTDKSVQFLARGAGYTLFLRPGEAVLGLHAQHDNPGKPGHFAARGALRPASRQLPSSTPASTIRLQLIGANTAAEATGVDPLPGKSNYFVGNDPAKWHTEVPTYAKVRYSNIYAGIDLVYYGNQEGRLEHDFVLAPGADPTSIAIGFRDSEAVVPDQNGGLTLHTKTGNLTLRRPVAYQTIGDQRRTVPAKYLLASNQIKFQLGSYDRKAELVVDPVIQYTAVFGGTSFDYGTGIAVDRSGNAYVVGTTYSTDFPVAIRSSKTPAVQ